MFRGDRDGAEALWRQILGVLAAEGEYERRLDAVLAEVAVVTQLPSGHVYVADESGHRFHLERSHGIPASLPGEVLEGGAGTISSIPPLELQRTPEDEQPRLVRTAAGQLYSLPLPLNGELVGLVQLGPVEGRELPGEIRRRLETISYPLAVVVRRAREEHELRQRLTALSARDEVGRKLEGSAIDLERFVGLLLDLALRATRTDAGFVATVEPPARELHVRAASGMAEGFAEAVDLSPDTGLFDWSPAAEGGALILRDFEAAARMGVRSLLAVPLQDRDERLGVFALVNFGEGGTFTEQSLELLETFAEQIKLMLANARLFKTFAAEYLETLKGLARSLDVRREYTAGHHRRVSEVAAAIAAELGLDPAEIEAIRTAGLVHDVGLAGVAQVEGGFQADVDHPTVGAGLVEHLPLHPAVAGAIASHHEWFDGWGFPHGLKGEQIPLGGRILGVTEFLVEMSSGDPFREPWGEEKLRAELEVRRGSQFDPRVADAVARIISRLPLGRPEQEA